MSPLELLLGCLGTLVSITLCVVVGRVFHLIRTRGLDRWGAVVLVSRPVLWPEDQPLEVFLAVCDHFEPEWGGCDPQTALARVKAWRVGYPRLFEAYRDVDGRPPQHTFFFPQDQYRPEYLDLLKELVDEGYGDVDIHLHHDQDTAAGLYEKLSEFRDNLFYRHELLRLDLSSGKIVYGFIHGNWALCNSRRDGKWCGVDHEIPVLLDTGCYADFTFPSAPSETQPPIINRIYYAADRPGRSRSHETGIEAAVGRLPPPDSLLMITGPLKFDFQRRKWGLLPRIENGDLLGSHPPSVQRLPLWLSAGITVAGCNHWRFIKLHTHGCKPANQRMWLSETVQNFHRDLAGFCRRHPQIRLHYVTAWEMAQLVHAAEQQIPLDTVIRPHSNRHRLMAPSAVSVPALLES